MSPLPLTVLSLVLLTGISHASTVTSTFEDLAMPPHSFNNNSPTGQFVSGGSGFVSQYVDSESFAAIFSYRGSEIIGPEF